MADSIGSGFLYCHKVSARKSTDEETSKKHMNQPKSAPKAKAGTTYVTK